MTLISLRCEAGNNKLYSDWSEELDKAIQDSADYQEYSQRNQSTTRFFQAEICMMLKRIESMLQIV